MRTLLVLIGLFMILGCSDDIFRSGDSDAGDLKIISLAADPQVINIGGSSKVTVIANKEEGLSYSWRADLGYIIGFGNEVRYSASICCAGTNFITCVVTDSEGNEASESILISIRN